MSQADKDGEIMLSVYTVFCGFDVEQRWQPCAKEDQVGAMTSDLHWSPHIAVSILTQPSTSLAHKRGVSACALARLPRC
jgi:hypothetical protein